MATTQQTTLPPRYLLGDDLYSRIRLNSQHFLCAKSMGYLIHPSIPQNDPNVAIADIGTGTGIWLIDLVDHLPPTAKLWGGDIRTEQFYPSEWLPDNIELQYMDVKEDIHPELENRFDVVQIRFLVIVLADNEQVTRALRNAIRMLKPGGYLQWIEPDRITKGDILKTQPSNSSIALEQARAMLHSLDARTKPDTWIANLGDFFKTEGLQNVHVDRLSFAERGAKWRVLFQETMIASLMEVQGRMAPGETKDRFGDTLMNALAESRAGAAWTYSLYTWIGQKV